MPPIHLRLETRHAQLSYSGPKGFFCVKSVAAKPSISDRAVWEDPGSSCGTHCRCLPVDDLPISVGATACLRCSESWQSLPRNEKRGITPPCARRRESNTNYTHCNVPRWTNHGSRSWPEGRVTRTLSNSFGRQRRTIFTRCRGMTAAFSIVAMHGWNPFWRPYM